MRHYLFRYLTLSVGKVISSSVAISVIALGACTPTTQPVEPSNPSHVGKVSVIDGDTLRMGETRIRLNGLHAPERGQPGFSEAKLFVEQFTAGEEVTCEQVDTDRYGRVVAICYVDGQDIAEELVTAGLGRDCQRYSGGRYQTLEQQETREAMPLPSYCY